MDTFVYRNGDLNFESPALQRLDYSRPRHDGSSVMDCDQTEASIETTPGESKDRPWRRQNCWDRSDDSISYAFTPDSAAYSRFSEEDEMIASSVEHNSTFFTAEFSYGDPPPPKRFKLNPSVNGESRSSNGKSKHCWGVLMNNDIHDLGVAPIREDFFPRASSTPVSSPIAPLYNVPYQRCEDSSLMTNASSIRHARRRLDFQNEDEEAVFYLVNKYLRNDD